MVFAINCGVDGSANSFSNFKAAAKATLTNNTTPANGGGLTIPPSPTATLLTQAVSLGTSVWTTTYSSYPDSPGPTPASEEGVEHKVIVGGLNLTYDPPYVVAKPRDRILFELYVLHFKKLKNPTDFPITQQPPKEPHCHSIHLLRPLQIQWWFRLWVVSFHLLL